MWFSVVAIVLDLVLIFLYYSATKNFSKGDYAITAALHIIIIVSLILAAKGINKDEKLIKDSNRLR